MNAVDVGTAVVFLAVLIAGGTMVHEFLHAVVLRVFGIPYTIEWISVSHLSSLESWLSVEWATVTPHTASAEVAPWQLRLAALAPLTIAAPVLLVGAGVLPTPFPDGAVGLKLAAIALLACAIPSPADFSLVWDADRALSEGETCDS